MIIGLNCVGKQVAERTRRCFSQERYCLSPMHGSQPFAKDNLQKKKTMLDSLAAARLAPTHNYFFDQSILIPDMNLCLLQCFRGWAERWQVLPWGVLLIDLVIHPAQIQSPSFHIVAQGTKKKQKCITWPDSLCYLVHGWKFTVIIKHWEELTLTSITQKSVCPGQVGNFEGWAIPITCISPAIILHLCWPWGLRFLTPQILIFFFTYLEKGSSRTK